MTFKEAFYLQITQQVLIAGFLLSRIRKMTMASTGPLSITDDYQEEKKDNDNGICFMREPHNEKKRKLVESKRDTEALSGKWDFAKVTLQWPRHAWTI